MDDEDRYSRQVRFTPVGREGQQRLKAARVAVVGCGALGGASAMALTRAGIGSLVLIDRDVPEASNLPRQMLFDEQDVAAGIPKAAAAAQRLSYINSHVKLLPQVVDFTPTNAESLVSDVDLIVDGTDNFEARFLINDVACRKRIPWIYGGAIGAEGRVMSVRPGTSACLRCLIPEPPAPGVLPTCDTAGILGPAAFVVGAVQAAEAIRILAQPEASIPSRLLVCDLWEGVWKTIDLSGLARRGCPTCRAGDHPWLDGRLTGHAARLCGSKAVQIQPATPGGIDLANLAERLRNIVAVRENRWLLRADIEDGLQLSVFADGRVIVSGTEDPARARVLVARYVG
jgi:molybdopterin/thiamine biosynthesis adenylyltransferase